MRARGTGSSVLIALGATVLVGGCVLFTGSTDGYTPQPSSNDGPTCGADGATCIVNKCVSAADCGDAGQVCCFGALSSTVVGWSCQSDSCSLGTTFQVCTTNAECGDAGACIAQTCTAQGISVDVSACGLIPLVCGADDGGPIVVSDAGPSEAGAHDASDSGQGDASDSGPRDASDSGQGDAGN